MGRTAEKTVSDWVGAPKLGSHLSAQLRAHLRDGESVRLVALEVVRDRVLPGDTIRIDSEGLRVGDLPPITPEVAWRVMAVVTQQHYLSEIDSTLRSIEDKVDGVAARMQHYSLARIEAIERQLEELAEHHAGGQRLDSAERTQVREWIAELEAFARTAWRDVERALPEADTRRRRAVFDALADVADEQLADFEIGIKALQSAGRARAVLLATTADDEALVRQWAQNADAMTDLLDKGQQAAGRFVARLEAARVAHERQTTPDSVAAFLRAPVDGDQDDSSAATAREKVTNAMSTAMRASGGLGVSAGARFLQDRATRDRVRRLEEAARRLGAWVGKPSGLAARMQFMSSADRLLEVESVEVPAVRRAPAGTAKTFRAYVPGQVLLMAPDAREWVPKGDLAHFVDDLVEEVLDLSAIYDSYVDGRGFPPYDPRLMVKLLVYGYAVGITSSRKLEVATHRDVAVRMLCAGQQPDFRAIGRFRARHLDALAGLFVQSLGLCRQAGLVGLRALAVDGTKLRAHASRHKAMSYERMVRAEAVLDAETRQLREIADRILAEAAAVDAAEDALYGPENRGDELPPELQDREARLAFLREAKAALEAEAEAAETARREQMRAEGREPRTPPDGRDPFKPRPRAQRNFTDPESKIMKTSDGSFHQCYNAQAVVDDSAQVIIAAGLSNIAPDAGQLAGVLEDLAANLAAIDTKLPAGARLLGDAGYFSAENILTATGHGLDPLLATGRLKHSDPPPIAPRGPIPKHATPKQRMARKLKTKAGFAAYARRKAIVEPVFGQMMTVIAARQLRLRGLENARAQWRFDCAIHNLLKLHRNGGTTLLAAG